MSLILKVMHGDDEGPVSGDTHSVYGDITSVTFKRMEDGSGQAHCYVREPVKTALVPGFCENERFIDIPANAYVMNDQGRTISTFTARRPVADGVPPVLTAVRQL